MYKYLHNRSQDKPIQDFNPREENMKIRINAINILIIFLCAVGLLNIVPAQTSTRSSFWPSPIVDALTQTNVTQVQNPSSYGLKQKASEKIHEKILDPTRPMKLDTTSQMLANSNIIVSTALPTSQTEPPLSIDQNSRSQSEPTPTPTPTQNSASNQPISTSQPTESSKIPSNKLLEEVRDLTNQARINEGMTPFMSTNLLDQAATCRANELLVKLSHDRPDGSPFYTIYSEFGIVVSSGAENFICGTAGAYSASQIVNEFLASPVHRCNILSSNFSQIGMGIVVTESQFYIVQTFAS
jgi:uncharacterized protein YkwD